MNYLLNILGTVDLHDFHVEPLSADELLLRSSDVGLRIIRLRIIRKVDGEWVVQDAASNQE